MQLLGPPPIRQLFSKYVGVPKRWVSMFCHNVFSVYHPYTMSNVVTLVPRTASLPLLSSASTGFMTHEHLKTYNSNFRFSDQMRPVISVICTTLEAR